MPLRNLVCLAALTLLALPSAAGATPESDADAARAVFERNLTAIAERDRDGYLATYLDAPTLARVGHDGPALGFEGFAAEAGDGWPEVFEAQDLRLVPVEPGVVYGTYRYRVVYGSGGEASEHAGLSERLFVSTPDGWRIAVTSAFEAPPGTPPPPRALTGATLIDGTGTPPVADAVVVMRGGEIDCAGSRDDCPLPEGIGVVDLSGRFLTPGLVDAHVHFSQTGWADGRPDALDVRGEHPYPEVVAGLRREPERFFRAYLCSGVTAVFDVGGYPWTWTLADAAETDDRAPRVAAAGPLLSTWDFWLNLPAERQFVHLADEAAARDGVDYLAAGGADAVKVWFIVTGERPMEEMERAVTAAGERARERGLPLIVHATGLAEAKAALSAGAKVLVHSVWEAPVDDEFLRLAKQAGTVYVPTLTVPNGYQRMFAAALDDRAPEIDDPNGCVDAGTRAKVLSSGDLEAPVDRARLDAGRQRTARQAATAADNLARVHAAGIPVAMGTDAGNPLTLHGPSVYAELEAMQAAGLSAMEVLVAATANGAKAMGRDDLGTVVSGNKADLAVLAADPAADAAAWRSVTHVVRGGVLRPAGELAASTM